MNNTTHYVRNARRWITSVTDPLGNQILYTYDQFGNVTDKTMKDAAGNTLLDLQYEADSFGDVGLSRDPVEAPDGGLVSYSFDANHNLTGVMAVNNVAGDFTYTYDGLNRLTSATDGANDVTQYTYDGVGNLTQLTDPLNQVTLYTYDDQGHRLTQTDPLSGTTTYTYNLAGWLTSVKDPDGNVTSYSYNAAGELVSETNPLNYTATYTYDAAGNETGTTDYAGNQTVYTYNEAGWKTGEEWLNAQDQVTYQATYTYNLDGQVTGAADNNSSYSYTYDADGRQIGATVTYPALSSQPLATLTYGYDGLGNRTSLSDSLGGSIAYTYTGRLLTGMNLSLNGTDTGADIGVSYNDNFQPTQVSYGGMLSASYGYDNAGRVTSIGYNAMVGDANLSLAYSYNAAGEVTSYTGPDGTSDYTYDNSGQLTGVSGAQTAGYSYDANGNRTLTGYQTGTGNQLLSDGTYTYTYDKDGRLATKTDSSGNVWTYTWDHRSRLVEVVEKNSQQQVVSDVKYIYDVNDNLIATVLNGVVQQWTVWDGKNPYLQFNSAGQVTDRYLTDPRMLDAFFAQVSASGDVEYLLTDRLGSVVMVTDDSGDVLDAITYDAYGNILSQTNAVYASLYLYAGGYLDGTTGLYRFGARWYDPATGRWISEDPASFAAGDADLYRFVINSPINQTDPTGLGPWDRWFGHDDRDFQRWFHRFYKKKNPQEGDQTDQEYVDDAYAEWESSGKPDGEGHKTECIRIISSGGGSGGVGQWIYDHRWGILIGTGVVVGVGAIIVSGQWWALPVGFAM